MTANSAIEWTHRPGTLGATWNPWHGCTKVSPGCKNCYMYRDKRRYGEDPRQCVRSRTKFNEPLKWRAPHTIFTCSWSDWFIKDADPWRDEAWDIIRRTPQHTYLILTKRIDRARDLLPHDWPLPNVWLGVSAENQRYADERIPLLLSTPAAIRFVSYEPALAAVDFSRWLRIAWQCGGCREFFAGPLRRVCPTCGREGYWSGSHEFNPPQGQVGSGIDWLIIGGESGPGARPFDVTWARSTIAQCKEAGVACFVKQIGSAPRRWCKGTLSDPVPGQGDSKFCDMYERGESPDCRDRCAMLRDRKGGDPLEWPIDLRVREFPQ